MGVFEKLSYGSLVTVLGVGIVFLALFALVIFIVILGRVLKTGRSTKPEITAVTQAQGEQVNVPSVDGNQLDPNEEAAVIAAVMAVISTQRPALNSGFIVRSVRRVAGNSRMRI